MNEWPLDQLRLLLPFLSAPLAEFLSHLEYSTESTVKRELPLLVE